MRLLSSAEAPAKAGFACSSKRYAAPFNSIR